MKSGIRFMAAVVAIVLLFLVSAFGLRYLLKAEPVVGQVDNFSSSDKQWVATLEEVDNGLGFGLGMLYDEVHIHRPNEKISDHGDDGNSVIFYVSSMGKVGDRPKIKWLDSTHLLISYYPATIEGGKPGKALRKFQGIFIEYETASLK